MAATAPHLRHHGDPDYSWVAVALAMLALAVGSGYTLALGEMAGLYVGMSLVCAVAILLDFRTGAVLLLVMLPISTSTLFPRSLLGIGGLNPLNLLVMATLASFLIHGRLRPGGALVPKQLVWLFIAPIVVAGLLGMQHVHDIPLFFYEIGSVDAYTERQYLQAYVVKPMVMVGVALLVGAAAARSNKPERFIIAIALAASLIALIQIGFVISQGGSLATMATTQARGFYEPLGMHANSLGRLHLFAFALMLFIWAETKQPGMKFLALFTLGLLGIAMLLTFSRAAIGGVLLVGALFVTWKFNAKTLSLVLIGLVAIGLFGADILYSRLTHGFDSGANAVSAGRIEGIWLPLLPELWKSPIWGNGLNSILWSYPMVTDGMSRVGHPHNAYLEALLDMGIVGLALLLAYYAHVWKGVRALGSNAWLSPELRGLFQGATAALVAFFVTGLVGSSLRPDAEATFLWIAIGLMYGLRGRRPAT